jgi:hypothetical protein
VLVIGFLRIRPAEGRRSASRRFASGAAGSSTSESRDRPAEIVRAHAPYQCLIVWLQGTAVLGWTISD